MQSRVAFNSGELSPEMSCRADMDQYGRGCSVLENWQISQLGGLKRRKGMRAFRAVDGIQHRLVPYIYSYANVDEARFLVDVQQTSVRVLSMNAEIVATFRTQDLDFFMFFDLNTLNFKQVNKLLFLTSSSSAPIVLKMEGGTWHLGLWELKNKVWRYNHEDRDSAVFVNKNGDSVSVRFEDAEEQLPEISHDYLRASFYLEQQESGYLASQILEGVQVVSSVPSTASKGDKFAILGEERYKCFTCIEDWTSVNNYRTGLDSPANYTQNFVLALENDADFDSVSPVLSVKGHVYVKNTKVKLKLQDWLYWTCREDFVKEDGKDAFTDYPNAFVEGIIASDALTCQGSWSTYCSGLWFGQYKVYRNFETPDISADGWRTVGISTSNLSAAANIQVSGNESDKECYLRLMVTKSRVLDEDSPAAGFIPDSCQNRLIVSEYKHDEILRGLMQGDTEVWTSENAVNVAWSGERKIFDWSWDAFSARYGYPIHCDTFQSRLVFAATIDQPQTIWMSRTDDLDNFMTGSVSDAALYLTLRTTSQNPICWVQAQSSRLALGTSECEYTVSSGFNSNGTASMRAVENSNVYASDSSHVGSEPIAALPVVDKVLYIERGAGRVYEYGYDYEAGGYLSRDLSILAPHIMSEHKGVVRSTLLRKPDTVAVFVLGDGQLSLCTYNDMQQVKAWHRWVTDGRILDACAMPDDMKDDKLFLLVQREGKVFIEVVDSESDYMDNGERDYISVFITNPLNNPLEANMRERNDTSFKVKFGSPFDNKDDDALRISCDGGENWDAVEDTRSTIPQGWLIVSSNGKWNVDKLAGLKVRGKRGCHILGLQA